MRDHHWTPEQINRLTLYQFYLAMGHEIGVKEWATPEQIEADNAAVRERLKKLDEKEKTMKVVEW